MEDGQSIRNLERIAESADRVAEDGYKLLRLNILIVGVILSASAFLMQSTSPSVQTSIIRSNYTQASVALWVLSTTIAYFAYEPARRLSALWLYDDPQSIVDKHSSLARLSFNVRYAMLLSLGSAISFGLGVFDGFLPVGVNLIVVWNLFLGLLIIGIIPIVSTVGYRRFRAWLSNTSLLT